MPIYEFRCKSCKQTEEVLQKLNDPAPEECPHCHSRGTFEKCVSHTSFSLKGGGWYKDLYASTPPAAQSSSSATSSSDSAKSAEKSPTPAAPPTPAPAKPAAAE